MKRIAFILCLLLGITFAGHANNISISNVTILNGGAGQIQVQFDLSWENSWRVNVGPNNYDGAWVFFKYKDINGLWKHIYLTGLNNVAPAGFDIYQSNEVSRAGAMIYREPANLGIGNVTITGIKLGTVNSLPYDIDVKGFAIEMVYIPSAASRAFYGDGDGTTESVNALHYTDNTATTSSVIPMLADVNTFDDAELTSDGIYVYSNDTIQLTSPLGSLDPFPTMKPLWCMKYELTQAAYRDFLNCLSYDQQVSRTANAPTSAIGVGAMITSGTFRNYIEIRTPGVNNTTPAVYGCDANGNNTYDEANDGEWLACNYINWQDMAAYLDWSGLAPMSELQFEKICRGISSAGANPAVLGEYAWGTNSIFSSTYTLTSAFSAAEIASNASPSAGNAAYFSTYGTGPLRNGIFATATSNRVTSGATYYGVMEMTGNLSEYCIHLGSAAGRSCRYIPNGNGTLSISGNAQLSPGSAGFWPGMEGNSSISTNNTCSGTCEVTGSAGIRLRGGSIADAVVNLAMADRSAVFTPTARTYNRGGRGVLYIR